MTRMSVEASGDTSDYNDSTQSILDRFKPFPKVERAAPVKAPLVQHTARRPVRTPEERYARAARGERQGSAKLSQRAVTWIRLLYAQGNMSQRELGKSFGVNPATICRIVTGKKWRHVTLPPALSPEERSAFAFRRQLRGERVASAKLRPAQVIEIRRRYDSSHSTLADLAGQYGLGQTTVYKIVKRKTWAHLP